MSTPAILQHMRRSRVGRTGRAPWLALALLVLAVQTGLPAHEASHHLGQADTLCQYCVLGGHLYSLPSSPPPPVMASGRYKPPLATFVSFDVPAFPRTHLSRGPPPVLNA